MLLVPNSGKKNIPGPQLPHLHDQFLSLMLERLNPNQTSGKTICVSSCRQGEGVSTIIYNMALAVSESMNKRVLLVDCNARSPQLSSWFGIDENAPGLMNVLEGSASFSEVLVQGDTNHSTSFIPAGKETKYPIVLFADEPFNQFLAKAREQFDIVLFDAPALAVGPETSVLARQLDSFILVTEAEKTRWEVVTHYKEQLADSGVRLTGAILNKKKMFIPRLIYRLLLAD